MAPRRLLKPMSMAHGVLNVSTLADSHPCDSEKQQNDNPDVEMENNPGDEFDYDAAEETSLPMRRIPRPLDHHEPLYDDLNHSDNAEIPSTQSLASLPARSRIQCVLLTLRDTLKTTFNSYGLCRLYPRRPSFEPDRFVSSSLLARTSPTVADENDPLPNVFAPPYPFPNMTIYRLMSWMNSGSNLVSETKVSRLVKDVLLAQDFNPQDLENFSVRQSLQKLDSNENSKKITFPDDWIQTSVTIHRVMDLCETWVCYTSVHLFSPTQSLSPKSSAYTQRNQCKYPAKMRVNSGSKQQGPPAGPPPPPYLPLSGGPNDPPPAPVALHNLLANLSPDVLLALAAQAVQGQAQQNLPRQNHIPQSLPPSDQHAIQPDLETASDVQALRSICENLQHEVNRLKCGHKDDGDEADDEDEPTDKGMRQKKKKKLTKGKIRTYLLNRPLQELSAAEKTTREELQECLDTAIFDVTGTSMDTIETDDSDGGDGGEDPQEGEKL
ncbi:hypothetical protein C8R48DRAFT_773540 [Suillus tomentosus]|nr:hypothetical protein C8R48DRAFT_773540 [Suillus tomentosus]